MNNQSRLKVRVTKTIEFYDTTSFDDVDVNTVSETGDPAIDIPKRVEALADMLDVSEAVAQRILLQYGSNF